MPAIDAKTEVELEAAAYRRLVQHLRARSDVQNIDLMNLAGFCRNCLANWYQDAAKEKGIELTKDGAREIVYGMPYTDWQAANQKAASAGQARVGRAMQQRPRARAPAARPGAARRRPPAAGRARDAPRRPRQRTPDRRPRGDRARASRVRRAGRARTGRDRPQARRDRASSWFPYPTRSRSASRIAWMPIRDQVFTVPSGVSSAAAISLWLSPS